MRPEPDELPETLLHAFPGRNGIPAIQGHLSDHVPQEPFGQPADAEGQKFPSCVEFFNGSIHNLVHGLVPPAVSSGPFSTFEQHACSLRLFLGIRLPHPPRGPSRTPGVVGKFLGCRWRSPWPRRQRFS